MDGIDYSGGFEGRLSIRGYDNTADIGITIRNSHFGGGGCSDGIQLVGGANGVDILDNTFEDLRQGSCGPHVDAIQGYGERNTVIDGNFFRNVDVGIGFYDGTNNLDVTDNVLVGAGVAQVVQIGGSTNGSTFIHNTVRGGNVSFASKSGSPPSVQTARDNVMVGSSFLTSHGGGCNCTIENNLMSGAVFVGGSNPQTYAGHELAPGSPGNNAATDGTDQGARIQ